MNNGTVQVQLSLTLTTPDPKHELNGSLLQGTAEFTLPKKKPVSRKVNASSGRLDHIWVERACFLFDETAGVTWDENTSASGFASLWRSPLMDMQRKILVEADEWKPNMKPEERWTEESLYAVAFCILEVNKVMVAANLDVLTPKSMAKYAGKVISSGNLLARARRYMKTKNYPMGPVRPAERARKDV